MAKLVIAEKPSVSKSIADVIGAKTRKNGAYEGGGYVVSCCIGHLVELAEPHDYDEKYKKWRQSDLPIMPSNWQYNVSSDKKKQMKILSDLMKRPDIDGIINACDAGREGELIFRLVYNKCGCKKPIERLWISSMEETAILEGFRNLKNGLDYEKLYQSAVCRGRADWLVGLNCTRLFSVLYDAKLRVGRVQTPTLALIVGREDKISKFARESFYTVEIENNGFIAAREKAGRETKNVSLLAQASRLKDNHIAEEIKALCDGKTAIVKSVQKQEKAVSAPKLYDLTTLQREANRLFGYTATQTLTAVQNLYEQKLATYPRTDSRFLTEDMAAGLPILVQSISTALPFACNVGNISVSQVINNAKVSDHHAIIPTPFMANADLSALPTTEKNLLQMLSMRLVSAVSDKHIFAETVVTLACENEIFTAKGKTVVQEGWKAIEQAFVDSLGTKQKDDSDKSLPELFEGQKFIAKSAVREGFTQPPKHFTEDLLLSSMENAGVENMPDDAERKGLGTPATRASIIENLVKSGFIERKAKNLLPTEIGVNLIKILPESVKSPMLTAEWENHLKRIENGELTDKDFMVSIEKFVAEIVATHNSVTVENKALFPSSRPKGEIIGTCPRCGQNVVESQKAYFCENKDCKFALWKDNKFFTSKKKTLTKEIAKTLLSKGRIFMQGLYSEKSGKTYSATIFIAETDTDYVSFGMEFEKRGEKNNEK